jgi:hypothetical protein
MKEFDFFLKKLGRDPLPDIVEDVPDVGLRLQEIEEKLGIEHKEKSNGSVKNK